MHIGFLCGEYPPGEHGGVGALTQTLARGLVDRGHAVTVVGQYRIPEAIEEADQGVRVLRLPAPRGRLAPAVQGARQLWRSLRAVHKAHPFDVLDGPELSYGGLVGDAAAPTVIRMHGGHAFFADAAGRPTLRGRAAFERRSFRKASHLVGVSRYVADRTRTLLGLPADRPVEVIPNPVDTARFRPLDEVAEASQRVLFVGTLCEKKGVRQLVEAWPAVLASFPEAQLVLAGRDSNRDLGSSFREMLERRSRTLGIRDAVEFLGPVPNVDLPRTLAAAAVCVYPSHMEACPVAWLEAMAAGKAIVASQTGPGPELVTHGETGLLCNPFAPDDIAEQVSRLLADEGFRHRLGASARARAVNSYSQDVLLPVNEAYFARCAGL